MRPGFRQAMTWLHNWTGLVVGWPLFAICGAGTLALFRKALDAWTHPELARGGTVDSVAAGEAAVAWLSAHQGHAPAWYARLADDALPGTLATYSDGKDFATTLIPAARGADALRDSLGGEFFYRFHFDLQLPYPWGRLLAVSAAFVLLTTLLTGIVAHRRIFKDFFTLRTGKDQRSWLDAHAVLGVLALPFHLMIAFTGIVTLASLALPWGGTAAYRGDQAALSRELYPDIARPAAGRPAPLAPVGPMLAEARRRFGVDRIAGLTVVNPGDAAAVVTVSAEAGSGVSIVRRSVAFDGATGRVLGETDERRPAAAPVRLFYGLHLALFADVVTRWLYFLSGLMLTGTIGAGLILWTRKPRRARDVGFALVERLNVGFVAGMPAAFAAFLLANRLLAVDVAGRAGLEVRWLFAVWSAALAWAALRPVRRAWTEMLALAAVLCLTVAIADRATVGGAIDAVTAGVDGTLIAFALSFGTAAWLVRPRGAPMRRLAIA